MTGNVVGGAAGSPAGGDRRNAAGDTGNATRWRLAAPGSTETSGRTIDGSTGMPGARGERCAAAGAAIANSTASARRLRVSSGWRRGRLREPVDERILLFMRISSETCGRRGGRAVESEITDGLKPEAARFVFGRHRLLAAQRHRVHHAGGPAARLGPARADAGRGQIARVRRRIPWILRDPDAPAVDEPEQVHVSRHAGREPGE